MEQLTSTTGERITWTSFLGRILRRAIFLALFCYAAPCLLLMAMESRLIYLPPATSIPLQQAETLGGEGVWFTAEDQTKLHGWFFRQGNTDRAILYFHGNGEDANQNLWLGAQFRDRLNASVLVFDYRGYGQSEGAPNEKGVISDGIAAQRWLAKRVNLEPIEIILFGRSLGGAVAVAAAEQLGARAVIVQNTFANMTDVAAEHYPLFPVRWLMRNRYYSQQRITHYDGPFLQFHGTNDIVVPIALARPLFEAAPSKQKHFVEIPAGMHNGPLPDFAFDALKAFLDALEPVGNLTQ